MTRTGWLDRARAICMGSALALGGACGPIEYVSHVTTGAGPAIEAARSADAAKWSPYWWTRANEYFHKAHEEAAFAHFEAANHFGRLSEDAAAKARDEALRRAADPVAAAKEMGPIDGAPVVAPPAAPTAKPGKSRKEPAKLAPTEDTP